jgi:outer membrane immunogenic protein
MTPGLSSRTCLDLLSCREPNPVSIRSRLRLAATGIALALGTTCAAADGIPGVVMTDSQYVTDWSGVYIGGKLDGAWSNFSWGQDANLFSTGAGVAAPPNTLLDFSPSGIMGGIIGGANLQLVKDASATPGTA